MATQPIESEAFRLDRVFRSDTLPTLRQFLEIWPDLTELVGLGVLQIREVQSGDARAD
jgi:hypothetical protein